MITKLHRENVKNNVRQAADIAEVIGEYVELRKAGTRLVGLCPFHSEKTPSFSVNRDRQFFYCFGCGASGDVFSFMMQYHRMEFPEALKALADKYQIDLPEREMSQAEKRRLQELEQLYAVNQAAADNYSVRLQKDPQAEQARDYLRQRGIPQAFVETYHLGYAPAPEQAGWSSLVDGLRRQGLPINAIEQAGLAVKKKQGGYYDRFRSRVMFPIVDMTGRVVAFGGRILGDGKPKYMNSPESPVFEKSRLLFGLYQHKDAIRKAQTALVVEGNFDLLALAVHGIHNVVAPLGTSLTRQHIKALRGYCSEVILLFDADAAGLKAAMRSVPFFLAERLDCRIALLPDGHDPDSLVREQGASGIYRYTENARPLPEFVFDTLVQEHGLTLHGKNKILAELQPLIAETGDPAQRNLMIAHFSEKLGLAATAFNRGKQKTAQQHETIGPPEELRVQMSKRERQLINFIIVYPECLSDFLDAGIAGVLVSSLSRNIVDCVEKLQKEKNCSSEQIMELLTGKEERQYVAQVLMCQPDDTEADNDQFMHRMKEEIILWLRGLSEKEKGFVLQQKIKEAEQQGDTTLLMQLLQQKMDAEKRRTNFS